MFSTLRRHNAVTDCFVDKRSVFSNAFSARFGHFPQGPTNTKCFHKAAPSAITEHFLFIFSGISINAMGMAKPFPIKGGRQMNVKDLAFVTG